jgi:hypothetical protein
MPDFSMSDLYSLFGQGGGSPPNRLQKLDPPAPEPYNYYGYGEPPEPAPPGPPEAAGPPDPMNEAIPPHLRQFYGQEGNYGQPPEAPPEAPGMMQRGWDATKGAVGGAAGAAGDALGNLNLDDYTPDAVNSALKAAEDAFKATLEAGKGATKGAMDAGNSAVEGAQQFGSDFMEGLHTGGLNLARKKGNIPPLPPRDREDPYYGRRYPSLERPQPGQDWQAPFDAPIRGEEWGDPYYTPQEPRLRSPLQGGRRRVERT